MNNVLNNIIAAVCTEDSFPGLFLTAALQLSPKRWAVKPSGGLRPGEDGEVKERGAQSVRTQVHSSQTVCLNPKADFSLWINFKHTIKFTYYVYVVLPHWMHAPQRQGLLCSYNSAWHVVAIQYCEWMDQINKNLKSNTIKHWKRSEEWELSHTANAGANLYNLSENNLATSSKLENVPNNSTSSYIRPSGIPAQVPKETSKSFLLQHWL